MKILEQKKIKKLCLLFIDYFPSYFVKLIKRIFYAAIVYFSRASLGLPPGSIAWSKRNRMRGGILFFFFLASPQSTGSSLRCLLSQRFYSPYGSKIISSWFCSVNGDRFFYCLGSLWKCRKLWIDRISSVHRSSSRWYLKNNLAGNF